MTSLLLATLIIIGSQVQSGQVPQEKEGRIEVTYPNVPWIPHSLRSSDRPVTHFAWQPGTPHSDSVFRDGSQILIINAEGITVLAALKQVPWNIFSRNISVDLEIRNGTAGRFDIQPSLVVLTQLKDGKAKTLKMVDPDALGGAQGTWVGDLALRINTLLPGEHRAGILWFENGGPDFLLNVPLAGKTFQFAFHFERD